MNYSLVVRKTYKLLIHEMFMKLLFKPQKQKELLKKEKEILGLSWKDFAKSLGLKYGRLKSFLYEGILIDEGIFNKLKLKEDYRKFIIKKLSNNWGQLKGGINSNGRLKEIKIPEKKESLAELWGIILGDGHIERIKKYKVGVYKIKIAGHSVDDRDYLLNFVRPLCEELFGVKSRIYQSKTKNCLYVMIDSRRIVDFFEENEFPAGNKIINGVKIPDWIKENNLFLAACLRGLYDTDGSFYRLTNQNSYQIHFKNYNLDLLNEVRRALLKLGINPSKIICNKSIVITKKSEIEKFYKLIGFSNPKHLNKIRLLF